MSVAGPLGRWLNHVDEADFTQTGLADGVLVHIGKLDLNVPPFVKMDYDTEARRLVLSIEDRQAKQQKEMWGASFDVPALHQATMCETC